MNIQPISEWIPLVYEDSEYIVETDMSSEVGFEIVTFDKTKDGLKSLCIRRSFANSEHEAIAKHNRAVEKLHQEEHPCRCGALNTVYYISLKLWVCPSCFDQHYAIMGN